MPAFDRNDLGKGSLNQFRGVLVPVNSRIRIRLAGSNQFQQELKDIVETGEAPLTTATARRTQQQEGADTEIEVRLFTGSRVSGPVGLVPRGLESVVDEALSRLDISGQNQRIPVEVVRKRGLFRVELLIGQTR
ncbi:hypothetical protein GCM10007382_22870 [Salinibacterium xinjiangense]|uniref:Uncharacterized protein n=1 Tax=Salinibacterium xinjiangense TaxID=386302 RepID=A0A2C8ZW39_9MICO|nr:hypothetical protein [Salinibacterium xinjiangense]GGL02374.1 hypothetical protein GCM10007382_22870 [Salinibacterium xinjiangense]SOE70098.1 hypothetical protein SAMN06296378_2138 [Salinibacterium xinjiangense]